MKIQLLKRLAAVIIFTQIAAFAADIPEPGLVMYGVGRNTAAGNARLIVGTLTWTITPASGAPVTVTTLLTDIISGQPSIRSSRREEAPFKCGVRNADCGMEIRASLPRRLPGKHLMRIIRPLVAI